MELKEYLKSLKENDAMIIRSTFSDKNYERANAKFQACCDIAEELQKMTSPKMLRVVVEFQRLPAEYCEAILAIAESKFPYNKPYYDRVTNYLTETYIIRLKKLVKANNVELLFCTKEKHKQLYKSLKTRVIDYAELLDIIYGLNQSVADYETGYKGSDKIKVAINEIFQFLRSRNSKKLEKIKEATFDEITDVILDKLQQLNARVGLE